MLELLAQATNYTTLGAEESAGYGGVLGFLAAYTLILIPIAIITIVGMWKVFEKAGIEGWKSIIPFYNTWVLAEIAGKPGWWGLVSLGGVIPVIGFVASIASFILLILISIEIAKAFGKDTGFAVLLILLPFIGFPILRFGDAKYKKPAGTPTPAA